MKQPLIWNFQFSQANAHSVTLPEGLEKDKLKWEARYFWADDQIIELQNIDTGLLKLDHYEHKQKLDYYFLFPNHDYNVKVRREQIVYKPLLEQSPQALAFGKKIDLEETTDKELQKILNLVHTVAHKVPVKKESYTYKFDTKPRIKLELAKLEVHNGIYYSACIEGRARELVEVISQALLGNKTTSDYERFLKTINPL